jgi:AcrR family transcriptional regulator
LKKLRKVAYHHGNLRSALLDAALDLVREEGLGAISLREVARRAGVSHAAPAHHFGDKAGLLTALATQGFELFAAALRAGAARAERPEDRLSWAGLAYVMFAAENRAYFEIMFRPELLHVDDEELTRASNDAYAELTGGVKLMFPNASEAEAELLAIKAWSEAHGLATLWLHGNLPAHSSADALEALARKQFGLPG